MSNRPLPEVGQTIYVSTGYKYGLGIVEMTVSRVGRKWFYAVPNGYRGNVEEQFSLETWEEKTHFGASSRAMSADEYAEYQELDKARVRMDATGYRLARNDYHTPRPADLTADQVNAIAAIIEQGATE